MMLWRSSWSSSLSNTLKDESGFFLWFFCCCCCCCVCCCCCCCCFFGGGLYKKNSLIHSSVKWMELGCVVQTTGPITLPALGRSRSGMKSPTWLWLDASNVATHEWLLTDISLSKWMKAKLANFTMWLLTDISLSKRMKAKKANFTTLLLTDISPSKRQNMAR